MELDCSKFACPHRDCSDFNRYGEGNIRVKEWYGKNNRKALLWCRTCHQTFSEHRGTPLFGAKLPEEKIAAILRSLCDGGGLRGTARTVGVHRRTVERLLTVAGQHAHEFNDYMLRDLKLAQVQVDEIHTILKKRRQRRSGRGGR